MVDEIKMWCVGKPGEAPRMFATVPESQLFPHEGEVVLYMPNYPARPHVISDDGKTLVGLGIDLDQRRGDLWAWIKGAYTRIAASGCDTPHGHVQTDPASMNAISQSVGQAVAAKVINDEDWRAHWIMTDNGPQELTADEMIALGAAATAWVSKAKLDSLAARLKIDTATTKAGLDEIKAELFDLLDEHL